MESPNRWFTAAVGVCLVTVAAGFAYFGSLESQAAAPCNMANSGCGGPDVLNVISSWTDSTTSLTLELFHGGDHNLGLSSYYVKDVAGNLYSAPYWIGPTFPANTSLNVTFTIDGKAFTFQPGNSYQVSSRTSEGNTVTFTITT